MNLMLTQNNIPTPTHHAPNSWGNELHTLPALVVICLCVQVFCPSCSSAYDNNQTLPGRIAKYMRFLTNKSVH